MVRCAEFYKRFEKKGNFCNKSDVVVRKIEDYIDYVKRKLKNYDGYLISSCAIEPLKNIEELKDGKVHDLALNRLKETMKIGKIRPERVTRRVVIELINNVNNKVSEDYKLTRIPGVRSKIGEYEHEIGEVGYRTRNMFDELKKQLGTNNNDTMKVMIEMCVRNINDAVVVKGELDNKNINKEEMELIVAAP